MNNTAGVVVSPNITTVASAVNDFINATGAATLTFSSFVLRMSHTPHATRNLPLLLRLTFVFVGMQSRASRVGP